MATDRKPRFVWDITDEEPGSEIGATFPAHIQRARMRHAVVWIPTNLISLRPGFGPREPAGTTLPGARGVLRESAELVLEDHRGRRARLAVRLCGARPVAHRATHRALGRPRRCHAIRKS